MAFATLQSVLKKLTNLIYYMFIQTLFGQTCICPSHEMVIYTPLKKTVGNIKRMPTSNNCFYFYNSFFRENYGKVCKI